MISQKTLKSIEFDKILFEVAKRAVLKNTKESIINFQPNSNLKEVNVLLQKTKESYALLYKYSVSGIYFIEDVEDALLRSEKGGTLNTREILDIAEALRGARILKTSIEKVNDEQIVLIREIASRLFTNIDFEKEVAKIILAEDKISDNASPKLYSIRKSIANYNAKIREQLSSYMHGNMGKYLQDNVVTIRQDRYVIPVKSEYKSFVKGFVHDQSSTGSTVFIEPEMVMELNNQLKTAMLEENEEIHRILADLSHKTTFMADGIRYNYQNVSEIDEFYARAIYSFENKYTYPNVNDKGIFDIKNGKHPLIDKDKVVPINFRFGENYNFLLITGPNTGGKTVTLKLTGIISLMAMSGLYVPCYDDSTVSIFNNVFCDVGDEQSIEQSLSTFSSHIKNIINIVNNCDEKSLVLIDEIGAGTDPEEGSALALAIIEKLLEKNCFGIITTHYSRLKEFASNCKKIKNASMEFDPVSLKPLYKINIGIPGSSNAIEIAKTLGLNSEIINKSLSYISDKKVSFEKVLKDAEESRREAEKVTDELSALKIEKEKLLEDIKQEKEKIIVEREKIYREAKSETKRIVSEKLCEAEDIIEELKSILKRVGLESKEVFRASELKNRLANSKYLQNDFENAPFELVKPNDNDIQVGKNVYVKSINAYADIVSIKPEKKEAEVLFGNIKIKVKYKDIFNCVKQDKKETKVDFNRGKLSFNTPKNEINVLGKTVLEALKEVDGFIDQAILHNLEEIRIVHGYGTGALCKAIRKKLGDDKRIEEFRRGKFGEGENGVTIVKLK